MSDSYDDYETAIQLAEQAWEQALEEKQEPVAWMYVNEDGECEQIEYGPVLDDPEVTPLYTFPPKKQWVGLTNEEIEHIADSEWEEAFVRMIEAKLKEKNKW
jgi:hypothetical protein